MQNDWFEQASAARLSGNDAQAIALCQQRLNEVPDDSDAMSLLGVCLAETSNPTAARPLIEKALAASPNNWRYLLNQSVLYEAEGNLSAAKDAATAATQNGPDRFECWGRLGDLSGRMNDYAGAAHALAKAVAINPDIPMLALRLASAQFETKDFKGAERSLDIVDRNMPKHPQVMLLRTHIARETRDWGNLINHANAVLASAPFDKAARTSLAYAYAQQYLFGSAVEAFRPLAEAPDASADTLATFGKYLITAREPEAGAEYHRKALAIDPNNNKAAAGLARYLNFTGDLEAAAHYARIAISADPNDADAFFELAAAADSKLTDDEIAKCKIAAENPRQGVKHRAIAWFVCGDAYHKRKDRENAFLAWQSANNLKITLSAKDAALRYNAKDEADMARELVEQFATDIPIEPFNDSAPTPIFIVGMPRSGTTLLDSAISAHNKVSSAGELPHMFGALKQFRNWAAASSWRGGAIPREITASIRSEYTEQYQKYGVATAPYITDKLPTNFQCVGLIRQVFPEARIIQIRRNPIETCFSIFRRNFSTNWTFTSSFEDLAHFYGLYARLTQHWTKQFSESTAFIQYEDFVLNFEHELRRLVSYSGLEWDPACLKYYEADQTVMTFSAAQVRKPPSPEHLDSTSPYEQWLGPLREALSSAGVDPTSGALIDG